ncbi:adenosylcobinamide-GDP ribazoletransferase [Kaistia defluvii]|uniref:adenosylcobinamide-GDP ribazoletransferase n=1 Tax=Kaistia defluvii TaxID=410841 RepID=UPI00224D1419|nr:adenosylcobinamide-GDP ribazoletransferase [Kaistia defluvii]MCX5520340.1 adenosylcobinamide-GDP ribazoletransferase [Kaistia defluvii]
MTDDQYRAVFRTSLFELAAATAFLTRLPAAWMGVAADRRPDFTIAARAFPGVGLLVGLVGAIVLLLAHALGMPLLASAALSLAATIALTGALHEDGLADTADGFGGGTTATRKLEIMRDSRIGTFGALALILSLLLRTTLVANLLPYGAWPVATALIGAEIVSRAAIVQLWAALPPARFEGLASATGRPSRDTSLTAIGIAVVAALICGAIGTGILPVVVALLVAGAATYAFQLLCALQIAGQTGDTLGAAQQVALVTYLMAIVAAT